MTARGVRVRPVGEVKRGVIVGPWPSAGGLFAVELEDGERIQARAPEVFRDAQVDVEIDPTDLSKPGRIVGVRHVREMETR